MERSQLLRRGIWAQVSDRPNRTQPAINQLGSWRSWSRSATNRRQDGDTDTFRFERELEQLRKEMELASSTGSSSTAATSGQNSPYTGPITPGTPSQQIDGDVASPLVLPGVRENAADMEVPELVLDRAVDMLDGKTKTA
jgi:hypothetical protein